MSRTGTSRRARTRYAMVSRVAVSAQCRSSTISSTGERSASRWNSPKSASNSLACTGSDCDEASSREPKAGTRRVRSRAAGPATAAVSTGPSSIARLRRASTNGPYGRLDPPTLPQSPRSTRNPRSRGEARGLARQPRLADAGLAGHEQMDGLAAGGAIQRALDRVELRIAADDDRAADAGRHDREDTREPCGSDNRHTSRASG